MTNNEALAIFIAFCNDKLGYDKRVTNQNATKKVFEILTSPEGRFYRCMDTSALLQELQWDRL